MVQPQLAGVKVVDLTTVVFGPYCTQILADLGADVIKVESPGFGDAFRWSAEPARTPGMAPGFLAVNRGKRSIALDLKAEDDLAVMRDLLRDADLFVVNVRGKALERLGLDYESVRALNPRIIYVHCVGFGQHGPYADLQAYDDVIQAATGTATLLPRVDGNPRPRYLPSLIADKVAGLHAAYGAMAALYQREISGQGQRLEVPMFEVFASFMMLEHLGGQTFDPPVGEVGYARQVDPFRQPFPTADGALSIVMYSSEAWDRVFAVLEDPDFIAQDRFNEKGGRAAHMDELYARVAELTPRFTTAELQRRCDGAQLPAQAVRDLAEVISDPHLNAVGFFSRREHPSEGAYFEQAQPVTFSSGAQVPARMPPRLDEHGAQIRAELAAKRARRSQAD